MNRGIARIFDKWRCLDCLWLLAAETIDWVAFRKISLKQTNHGAMPSWMNLPFDLVWPFDLIPRKFPEPPITSKAIQFSPINEWMNQYIFTLKSKQQNDNEQEQSLRVNCAQRQVSLHWRVPKLHRKKSKYNTQKPLNLLRSYTAWRLLKNWTVGNVTMEFWSEFQMTIRLEKIASPVENNGGYLI